MPCPILVIEAGRRRTSWSLQSKLIPQHSSADSVRRRNRPCLVASKPSVKRGGSCRSIEMQRRHPRSKASCSSYRLVRERSRPDRTTGRRSPSRGSWCGNISTARRRQCPDGPERLMTRGGNLSGTRTRARVDQERARAPNEKVRRPSRQFEGPSPPPLRLPSSRPAWANARRMKRRKTSRFRCPRRLACVLESATRRPFKDRCVIWRAYERVPGQP